MSNEYLRQYSQKAVDDAMKGICSFMGYTMVLECPDEIRDKALELAKQFQAWGEQKIKEANEESEEVHACDCGADGEYGDICGQCGKMILPF